MPLSPGPFHVTPSDLYGLDCTWPCARSLIANLGPEAASSLLNPQQWLYIASVAPGVTLSDSLGWVLPLCFAGAAPDLEPTLVFTLALLISNQATGWGGLFWVGYKPCHGALSFFCYLVMGSCTEAYGFLNPSLPFLLAHLMNITIKNQTARLGSGGACL